MVIYICRGIISLIECFKDSFTSRIYNSFSIITALLQAFPSSYHIPHQPYLLNYGLDIYLPSRSTTVLFLLVLHLICYMIWVSDSQSAVNSATPPSLQDL
jgi:hypothetical protein